MWGNRGNLIIWKCWDWKKRRINVYPLFGIDIEEEAIIKNINNVVIDDFVKKREAFDIIQVNFGEKGEVFDKLQITFDIDERIRIGDLYILVKEIYAIIFSECKRIEYDNIMYYTKRFIDLVKDEKTLAFLKRIRQQIEDKYLNKE